MAVQEVTKKKVHKSTAIAFSLIFFLSLIFTEISTYSLNTLFNNNKWVSHKSRALISVNGDKEFLLLRTPLHQNKLNLGKYYSHHLITSKRSFNAQTLSFDLTFTKTPFFEFFFEEKGQTIGLRITQNEVSLLKGTIDGIRELITSYPLMKPLKKEEHISLSFNKKTTLETKENKLELPSILATGKIGFTCGVHGCLLDNIDLLEKDGNSFHESFRNTKGFFSFFALFFFLLSFLFILFFSKPYEYITLLSTLIILSLSYYIIDFYYYSKLTHIQNGVTKRLQITSYKSTPLWEEYRFNIFYHLGLLVGYDPINPQQMVDREYPRLSFSLGPVYSDGEKSLYNWEKAGFINFRKKDSIKLLFLGSSQMLGCGSTDLSKTFFHLTLKHLNENSKGKKEVEGLNYSLSAANARSLYLYYRQFNFDNPPHYVIINLGNNGTKYQMKDSLPRILSLNKLYNIKTLLFAEANRRENKKIKKNKYEMIKFATSMNIPLFNGQRFIERFQEKDPSLIWWDNVHFNDFGQKVYADFMKKKIIEVLKRDNVL